MKTNLRLVRCALLLALSPALALASGDFFSKIFPPLPPKDQNQVSGIIFANDVSGEVEVVNGETGRITDMKKGDQFTARGTRIYTHDKADAVLLFSNETSVYMTANTQLRVEKFDQEPFEPNNNLLIEPSNSQLIVYYYVEEWPDLVISTPQLLSGTRIVFEVPALRLHDPEQPERRPEGLLRGRRQAVALRRDPRRDPGQRAGQERRTLDSGHRHHNQQ